MRKLIAVALPVMALGCIAFAVNSHSAKDARAPRAVASTQSSPEQRLLEQRVRQLESTVASLGVATSAGAKRAATEPRTADLAAPSATVPSQEGLDVPIADTQAPAQAREQ